MPIPLIYQRAYLTKFNPLTPLCQRLGRACKDSYLCHILSLLKMQTILTVQEVVDECDIWAEKQWHIVEIHV